MTIVVRDPQVMGGRAVFRGTRVPISVLFENLADGVSLDQILENWPSLQREDVLAVLQDAQQLTEQSAA